MDEDRHSRPDQPISAADHKPLGSEQEQEQEQGLLKEWKSSAKHSGNVDRRQNSAQWRRWSPSVWVCFMVLLIAILLVGTWIVSDFSIPTGEVGHSGESHGADEALAHLHAGDEPPSNEQSGSDASADLHDEQEQVEDAHDEAAVDLDLEDEVQDDSPASLDDATGIRTNDYVLDSQWDYNAPPQRREYNWTVRDHEHNPDGVYRPMMLVNQQFPGPLIEVNEGDTIVVNVDNQAVNATAVHWHGIYQNNTPHMDGTIGITQCPIASGQKFTYEFTVSGQSGTYWWHSHQGVQSSDGVHGPLIIHAKDEKDVQPIPYDTDRVLLISDHYHDLSSALLWQYLLPDMENAEPVPQGGLINGRGVRNCDDFPARRCDNTSDHVGLPRLDLAPNQRHRLRLINVGAFAEFQFQIDEHELAVTEVDGTDVESVIFHRLNINPAQRYSVILDTSFNIGHTFWLRARMVTRCFTDPPSTLEPDITGIVRYVTPEVRHEGHEEEDQELPDSIDWEEQLDQECRDLNTTELHPIKAIAAPAEPDAFFYLRSNFEIGAYRLSRGKFNSSIWRPDISSPTLYRTIDGITSANDSFRASNADSKAFVNNAAFDNARELVIQTSGIQVIDLVISNFDDGTHPIHLHGYKYFVLAQGHGYPPLAYVGAEISQANLAPLYDSLDLSNPLRRDTASVEAFGWIMIRLIADNPGAWALHCHVSWHTEAGLMMQLITRADELASIEVPNSNYDLCAAEGIEKGSGPRDEDLYQFAR